MDYCMSTFHKQQKEEAIVNYFADGLYALVNKNMTYERRLYDVLHPLSKKEQEKIKKDNKAKAKSIVSKLQNKLRG